MPAGLFSATQTEAVEALARAGLRNPGAGSCLPDEGLCFAGTVDCMARHCWLPVPVLPCHCACITVLPRPSSAHLRSSFGSLMATANRPLALSAVRVNVAVARAQPADGKLAPSHAHTPVGALDVLQRTPSTLQIQVDTCCAWTMASMVRPAVCLLAWQPAAFMGWFTDVLDASFSMLCSTLFVRPPRSCRSCLLSLRYALKHSSMHCMSWK